MRGAPCPHSWGWLAAAHTKPRGPGDCPQAARSDTFSSSRDGGVSWSAPIQVNQARNVQAFTASIDVAGGGAIGITYYDLRHDNSDPPVLLTDFWKIVSKNGGLTWREAHVGGPFDMRWRICFVRSAHTASTIEIRRLRPVILLHNLA